MGQLPLPLKVRDGASFDDYLGPLNAEVRTAVEAAARGQDRRPLFLWGPPGTGKSHLLLAACASAPDAVFVPARQYRALDVEALAGLEELSLICLDDLQLLLGAPEWERALFDLFERALAGALTLVVSAHAPPRGLAPGLPDLGSRLRAALVLQLQAPDDAGRKAILQARARRQGFRLPDDAAELLLRRAARDLPSLLGLLDRIDRRALGEGRRVTLKLVRAVLAEVPQPAAGMDAERG